MGITIGPNQIRCHGIQDAGIHGGRGAHVQVGGPALAKRATNGKFRVNRREIR